MERKNTSLTTNFAYWSSLSKEPNLSCTMQTLMDLLLPYPHYHSSETHNKDHINPILEEINKIFTSCPNW